MSIVGILQLVGGQFEVEFLFIDPCVRPRTVHINLRVLILSRESISSEPLSVGASISTIPTVLFDLILASPNLGILTEDVGKTGPEVPGVLDLGDDVGDEGLQGGPRGGHHHVVRPVHGRGHEGLVVVVRVAHGLSFAQPRLATILKHLHKNGKN